VVELTDPVQVAPPAGFDLRLGLCFVQMTVASTGITQPIISVGLNPDIGVYSNEGLEMARARIIGGPVGCPKQ